MQEEDEKQIFRKLYKWVLFLAGIATIIVAPFAIFKSCHTPEKSLTIKTQDSPETKTQNMIDSPNSEQAMPGAKIQKITDSQTSIQAGIRDINIIIANSEQKTDKKVKLKRKIIYKNKPEEGHYVTLMEFDILSPSDPINLRFDVYATSLIDVSVKVNPERTGIIIRNYGGTNGHLYRALQGVTGKLKMTILLGQPEVARITISQE